MKETSKGYVSSRHQIIRQWYSTMIMLAIIKIGSLSGLWSFNLFLVSSIVLSRQFSLTILHIYHRLAIFKKMEHYHRLHLHLLSTFKYGLFYFVHPIFYLTKRLHGYIESLLIIILKLILLIFILWLMTSTFHTPIALLFIFVPFIFLFHLLSFFSFSRNIVSTFLSICDNITTARYLSLQFVLSFYRFYEFYIYWFIQIQKYK